MYSHWNLYFFSLSSVNVSIDTSFYDKGLKQNQNTRKKEEEKKTQALSQSLQIDSVLGNPFSSQPACVEIEISPRWKVEASLLLLGHVSYHRSRYFFVHGCFASLHPGSRPYAGNHGEGTGECPWVFLLPFSQFSIHVVAVSWLWEFLLFFFPSFCGKMRAWSHSLHCWFLSESICWWLQNGHFVYL